MCTWIRLLVFIYSFISSIFFLSNSRTLFFFVTLLCEAYKVESWYIHGQRVDLLCRRNTSSQNILVPLFFFFFLSLQLAKIRNSLLQKWFQHTSDGYGWGYKSFAHSLLYFSYAVLIIKLFIPIIPTENHRTQTQYNDALIIKLFGFQFANNYTSCFYIAFFRGVSILRL